MVSVTAVSPAMFVKIDECQLNQAVCLVAEGISVEASVARTASGQLGMRQRREHQECCSSTISNCCCWCIWPEPKASAVVLAWTLHTSGESNEHCRGSFLPSAIGRWQKQGAGELPVEKLLDGWSS